MNLEETITEMQDKLDTLTIQIRRIADSLEVMAYGKNITIPEDVMPKPMLVERQECKNPSCHVIMSPEMLNHDAEYCGLECLHRHKEWNKGIEDYKNRKR